MCKDRGFTFKGETMKKNIVTTAILAGAFALAEELQEPNRSKPLELGLTLPKEGLPGSRDPVKRVRKKARKIKSRKSKQKRGF